MRPFNFAFIVFFAGLLSFSIFAPFNAQASTKKTAQRKIASANAQLSSGSTSTPSTAKAQRDSSSTTASSPSMGLERKPTAFIDPQLTLTNEDASPERGFSLNDAALYFAKDFSRASAFVDLSFRSSGNPNAEALEFAVAKSQAHLHYRLESAVLTFGQYDSFFGVESEDSRDRFFANQGILAEFLHPATHTGVLAKFNSGEWITRAQIANPNGDLVMGNQNPEFGGQIRLEKNDTYGALGLSVSEAREGINRQSSLVDMMVGSIFSEGRIHFDFEASLRKESGSDQHVLGLGAYGNYLISEAMTWGARVEILNDAQGISELEGGVERLLAFSIGPSYRLETGLTVRGDFSFASLSGQGSEESDYGLTVSAVADL